MGIALIRMKVVGGGLPLENAPKTPSTWLDLKLFLDTVGGVARYVKHITVCIPRSLWMWAVGRFSGLYLIFLFNYITVDIDEKGSILYFTSL